jgi:hypothetical protein
MRFKPHFSLLLVLLAVVTGCGTKNLNIDPKPGTKITMKGLGTADGGGCKDQFTLPANPTVLTTPTVVNLYWGSYWQPDQNGQGVGFAVRYWVDDRANPLLNDPDFWAPLGEYSTGSQKIGYGSFLGGYGGNAALASGNLSRSDIETELGKEIDGTSPLNVTFRFAQPSFSAPSEAIYLIWLPPGVTNSPDLDGAFGYHQFFSHKGKNVTYGVIGYLDQWKGNQDSMFITETHEIYETVTDPLVTSGWRDGGGNEIGDVCGRAVLDTDAVTEWFLGTAGSMSIQKEWSIKKCGCVDVFAYGTALHDPPIKPGTGPGSGGTPSCGVPGKPPCFKVKAVSAPK